ncbi:MAG: hypothetical protein ABFS56_24285 [Pseudomonadota bacterium]
MFYQSSGKAIRQFIHDKIMEIDGAVVLLAHSLGGIACAELLAEADKSLAEKVKLLVTVGSQTPYLYELDVLQSLRFEDISPDERLPSHFPAWLNVYDQHDLLSYIGKDNNYPQIVCQLLRREKYFLPWDCRHNGQ